jgi:lysophospholipase L1-like esterase
VARHHRQFAQAGMAVVIAVVAMLGAVVPAAAAPDQRYYLSLGDSLAYGFQRAKAVPGVEAPAFNSGFSDVLADRLRHGPAPVRLVNFGCPGESTVTYLRGGCPWTATGGPLHDPYSGPQGDASLAFLAAHRGHVDVITVSLWSNDATAFIQSCQGDLQCIRDGAPAAIEALATRLAGILGQLRAAAPDAQLVVLGAVDVNVGTSR